MFRIYFKSIGLIASLVLATAHAQSAGYPLSADQVRAEFASFGYEAGSSVYWTWSTPGLTTFQVREPASARVLMVLVYPDMATASAERARAARFEGDLSPSLIPGYGPSTWRDNVALVQSNEYELQRMLAPDYELEMRAVVRSTDYDQLAVESSASAYAVDLDFQRVLNGVVVNM
jgi:hypothetical protein